MYIREPALVAATVPGGQAMNTIVADCHPQWDGPAIVVSSNSPTARPSRDQP
jgi:hypothetical protein